MLAKTFDSLLAVICMLTFASSCLASYSSYHKKKNIYLFAEIHIDTWCSKRYPVYTNSFTQIVTFITPPNMRPSYPTLSESQSLLQNLGLNERNDRGIAKYFDR